METTIMKIDKKLERKRKLRPLEDDYINYNTLIRFLMLKDNREVMEDKMGKDGFEDIINDLAERIRELYTYKIRRWYEF